MTPLHEAAWCGNEYAVRLFLSREAKLEMIDGVRTVRVRHRDGNSSRGGGVGGEGLDGLGWVDGWVWDGGGGGGGGGGSVAWVSTTNFVTTPSALAVAPSRALRRGGCPRWCSYRWARL
jgi:hypothetical protein